MKNQMHLASVLGIPANKVVCKAKRLGGGFGGKETRSCVPASNRQIPDPVLLAAGNCQCTWQACCAGPRRLCCLAVRAYSKAITVC